MDQGSEGGPASLRGSVADLAIVDAHQHFWDPVANYHPWLRDEPPIPFRYGDYRAIRRRYLPPDYRADAAPIRIDQTVYVETEWDPADPVGEMRYVASLRQEFGLPTVAVAACPAGRSLMLPRCLRSRRRLRSCAAFATSRGPIALRRNPRPAAWSMRDGATVTRSSAATACASICRRRGGIWREATRLANDFPDTPMILNHTGLPADRSAEGIAGWKAAMQTLASCPNVAVKISGLGQQGQPWTVAANRDIVLTTIDLFGPSRCMFASNFPVDSLCASFHTIFGGFREIVRGFSADEQRGLFHDNAIRIYGMEG